MFKMYCVFSKEAIKKMGGIRGKMAGQSGHAYLHSYWNSQESFPDDAIGYKNSKHPIKIALITENDEELFVLFEKYKKICGATLVKDAGFTVFKEPTITCIGIGPISEDKIDEDLKCLPLFK
jgi:peptidyl-tRNA hydrolase